MVVPQVVPVSSSRSPGLYLHIPFCSAICPYCDFAVTTGDAERRARFVDALVAEVGLEHRDWSAFDTVYLGGGTPSLLSAEELARVLEAIRESVSLAEAVHISLEANPEDVDGVRARQWLELGVDRLSLGVQSFDAEELVFLGRKHSPDDARRAVETGLATGFTVSMDLIYGLPGQAADGWQANLESAVALSPQHMSCYQLTVDSGTPFAVHSRRGDWALPGSDELEELFFRTHEFLGASGYPAYEVSNFARAEEHQCRHNRKYWQHVPYLGLGPSAHSFDGRRRWWNHRSERPWRLEVEAGRTPEADREELTFVDLALEKIMLGLRTPRGVDLRSLAGIETKAFLDRNARVLSRSVEEGLLEIRGKTLVPSLAGMARADGIARSIEI
ncbi:MAG: radical SAM family heme chaperone HemW [Thermoanaerobaculia bacterium]